MSEQPNKFCAAPFHAIFINHGGGEQESYSACCTLPRETFPGATTLEKYLNHPKLAELKEIFKEGAKIPESCIKCVAIEKALGDAEESHRLQHNNYLNCHSYEGDDIRAATVTLSNICNLECDICQSRFSKKKGKHEIYLDSIGLRPKEKYNVDYPSNRVALDSIDSILTTVTSIAISGGEPFLHYEKEQLDMLSRLSKNCEDVLYITNCTVFPSDKVQSALKKIKRLHIRLSVDGTGAQFEYARYPAKWPTALKNIKKWNDLLVESDNPKPNVKSTVSVYTILWMPELIDVVSSNNFGHEFNLLSYPDYQSIQSFPIEIKDKISEILLAKSDNKKIKDIIQYMYTEDNSHLYEQTKKIVREIDKHKGMRYDQLFPYENSIVGFY